MQDNGKYGSSVNGHRYVFDTFEVDPSNRTCTRAGEPVPITGKVFDVLLAFVENPDRLLGKDELMGRVWPNEFVEEGNLARSISTLRKALGDTGKAHRFIATVQGHGYRFIADVRGRDDADRLDNGSVSTSGGVDGYNGNMVEQPAAVLRVAHGAGVDGSFRTQFAHRPWLFSIAALCLLVTALVAFRSDGERPRAIDRFSLDRLKETRLAQKGNANAGGLIRPMVNISCITESTDRKMGCGSGKCRRAARWNYGQCRRVKVFGRRRLPPTIVICITFLNRKTPTTGACIVFR